jgi:nitrogen-specific signal transduction histidine kinase/CheY-like chemotaxis protein
VLCYEGTAEDITTQRNLETQLRQAQKMESIGQLAAGVAHDFNNLLTVIQGNIDLAIGDLAGHSEVVDSLKQVSLATMRAANLTRQLLAFSRKQVLQPKTLDLNEAIQHLVKMLQRIMGEDIALECAFSTRPALVHADVNMMEQVLLNLCVNARDAMPDGGKLNIQTEVLDIDGERAAANPQARAGRFVCLSVADTGCGIPAEILPCIFEPFFTTKEPGKGTGLGLATVFGIAQQHQGWVEVESAPGHGATFRVYLPPSNQASGAEASCSLGAPRSGQSETILLVEDDPSVCLLTRMILKRHGYNVLEARSGPDALQVWAEAKGKVHLLLTDMRMPDGMTGRDLADQLRAQAPELAVVFVSGYSAGLAGREFQGAKNTRFLAKPFDAPTLCQTIRECLDGYGLNCQGGESI